MLHVDHYELIRRKRLIEGLSIRAISRELGHSRQTIRRAIRHDILEFRARVLAT